MNSMDCVCKNWARDRIVVLTNHHPKCAHYNPEQDAKEIVAKLVDGIEAWATDEDGVHPDCWEAYLNASAFICRIRKIGV